MLEIWLRGWLAADGFDRPTIEAMIAYLRSVPELWQGAEIALRDSMLHTRHVISADLPAWFAGGG